MNCDINVKFVGVIIAGGLQTHNKVEVFNPNTKRVCALPDMPGTMHSKGTICGNLLCAVNRYYKNCLKWENSLFVTANVNLVQQRYSHLCWAHDNGVLLLGGAHAYASKERFSKFYSRTSWKICR